MQVRAWLAALVLAAPLAVAAPGAALAHTELTSTTPRDGQSVAAPPAEIRLVFRGELQREFAQLVVSNTGTGARVDLSAPQVSDTTVRQPMPAQLAAGSYVVAYRVVAADGHPITGQFRFEYVAPPPAASAPASASASPSASVPATSPAPASPALPPPTQTDASDAADADSGWAAWGWLGGIVLLAGAVLVFRRSRRAG